VAAISGMPIWQKWSKAGQGVFMNVAWENSIYRQREALENMLRDPIETVTHDCASFWGCINCLENIFLLSFARIPYCAKLYALNTNGIQITESVGRNGIQSGSRGQDCSQRPFMKKLVPAWGFLLSDAYLSLAQHQP
jgi:hypothetical protein